MLTMDQKQQILHHYRVDEDGLREISRKVGVDRKTVRCLIQAFEERLSSDVLKVALHSQRVIYLRLACSGGPFFKSKMGEIYFTTYTQYESIP